MEMNKENFVTCDLLDANPESQVCLPNIEGKVFRHFGAKDKFCGEIVTVKCLTTQNPSRLKKKVKNRSLTIFFSQNSILGYMRISTTLFESTITRPEVIIKKVGTILILLVGWIIPCNSRLISFVETAFSRHRLCWTSCFFSI